jgi:uncharacterized repeat protein (TIGR03806 family)
MSRATFDQGQQSLAGGLLGRLACLTVAAGALLGLAGCGSRTPATLALVEAEEPPDHLSAWGLFRGNGSSQEPAAGVIPYDVNTPLFSDYAAKFRFVRLPAGTVAHYRDSTPFDFPIGTVLVKTFAYPHDERDPGKGRRLIETRLLLHKTQGWTGITYVWNDEQTEATIRIAGGDAAVNWIDATGQERRVNYLIPNTNQCLGCHENRKVMRPIGLTARNLNRTLEYGHESENQLAHWTRIGILEGAPAPEQAPRLAVWNDPATGGLEERARAWLESNCAHCHNPEGPARTSGLDLTSTQSDGFKRGFWKPPVAAGRGSGGRSFGVVPGKPDESILVHRIESQEVGVMMPELGRRLIDKDGAALVRAWVASLQK